jgi:hypothetical protein
LKDKIAHRVLREGGEKDPDWGIVPEEQRRNNWRGKRAENREQAGKGSGNKGPGNQLTRWKRGEGNGVDIGGCLMKRKRKV